VQEIAIIIPFFQQAPGILARALNSVASQPIPEGWSAEVIVVDDGSPRPAEDETGSLRLPAPLRLRVVRQRNGGVAAARNRGLDEASLSATLIAFLDSDDEWPPDHLARAIKAYDSGFDFYFADKRIPAGLQRVQMDGAIAFTGDHSLYLEQGTLEFLGVSIEVPDMESQRLATRHLDFNGLKTVILNRQFNGPRFVALGRNTCTHHHRAKEQPAPVFQHSPNRLAAAYTITGWLSRERGHLLKPAPTLESTG
jgi:glycosyltransferase involved in cell wall biosynthesis